ncbi:FtsX-like permease family protein [Rhodobacteraceae bacterium N5(2021)]|uniref:FtsX-like permease family protein n=1 Tax=Gymnodinialimonas phycosphaerae TaxID=2841589 RepID=A0A975TTC5_9RHOB|nr:FtsX-like permease family protein [Gymnodinialimonas phycosphaerae]MBY4894311.1 FtsX-like permease family protein [Gymnodinialimonas phycosphaerae]
MLYTAFLSLFSYWKRHPGQFAMLALGLALATALWSGVQAINAEARAAYDRAAATLGQDQLARLERADGRPMEIAEYLALRAAGYLVSPVISGEVRDANGRLRILGIDPLTTPAEAQGPALDGAVDLAAFFTAPGLLLMSEATANGALPADLPPISVSENVPPAAAITDISTAARLLGQNEPSYLLVATAQPMGLPPITDVTELSLRAPDNAGDIARLTDSFHLNLTAFGLLSFGVGLFIVHAAIGLAFEQRRAIVRTLRALGTPLRTILLALSLELAAVALLAGAIGVGMGYVIAASLMPGVAGTLRGLYGAEIEGVLQFSPYWAVSGLLITFVGTAAAAIQAMIRTARMPLLAPAMPRAWAQASGRMIRLQALAALGLFTASGLLALLGQGLIAAFGCLACLLIGAALALPVVMSGALSLVRPKSAFAEWVVADTRQQIPGLSLALMALLLALSANIGVSTMVGSFRTTFLGWLDQRLASELYVTAATPDEAALLMEALAPDVDAILPIVSTEIRLFGQPADLFGVVDHATYRDAWPFLSEAPDPWGQIATGDAILINEQLARRENLTIGDLANGLPIVGIYSDYGNPQGQAIVSLSHLSETYPDLRPRRFAIRIAPSDAPALATRLRDDFGLPADAVTNQAQVKAFSIEVFDQTFRVTGALNVLTLGVAGIALLTSLLTLANLRLPQLAPIWAIGASRARLAWVEMARSLILAAITFLAALPVGLLLAWILLALVNVEAFGWRLPMQLFPGDWLRLGLLALLAAGLAALGPTLRLARMPPARLTQVFAQER